MRRWHLVMATCAHAQTHKHESSFTRGHAQLWLTALFSGSGESLKKIVFTFKPRWQPDHVTDDIINLTLDSHPWSGVWSFRFWFNFWLEYNFTDDVIDDAMGRWWHVTSFNLFLLDGFGEEDVQFFSFHTILLPYPVMYDIRGINKIFNMGVLRYPSWSSIIGSSKSIPTNVNIQWSSVSDCTPILIAVCSCV